MAGDNGKPVIHDEVVRVPVGKLKPSPSNPNRMTPLEKRSLEHGIRTEGFVVPVLVQTSTNCFIDGEHRWKAAKKCGMKEIPVIFLDVDDATARKLTLAMIHRKGEARPEDVALLLKDIQEAGAQSLAQLEMDTAIAQERLLEMLGQVDDEGALADELAKGAKKAKAKNGGKGKLSANPAEPGGAFVESEIGDGDEAHQFPLTFFAPTIEDRDYIREFCADPQSGELSFERLRAAVDLYRSAPRKKAVKKVKTEPK